MPYSESVYPITLVETLKPISTIILCFGLFCLLYIQKFLRYIFPWALLANLSEIHWSLFLFFFRLYRNSHSYNCPLIPLRKFTNYTILFYVST